MVKAQRALISLTDKSGIEVFVERLVKLGIEILSTGGTAKKIRDHGLPVKDVAEFTGFPEILDGRVKTLHPKIHGGLLARRDNPEHLRQMQHHDLQPIDIVAVNLYSFAKSVADPNCSLENAVENIDIGGPAMLRSAAKNFRDVTVIVDPADYPQALAEITEHGNTTRETRFRLAIKVFELTANYDLAIATWLKKVHIADDLYFK